jgi:hypothetical protein
MLRRTRPGRFLALLCDEHQLRLDLSIYLLAQMRFYFSTQKRI